jgi:hypothetical protein
MEDTTPGVEVVTQTGSQPEAAHSRPKGSAKATRAGSKSTKKTKPPAKIAERQAWTLDMARGILANSIRDAARAGLEITVYNSVRDTIVIELLAHQVVDGVIVPVSTATAEPSPSGA